MAKPDLSAQGLVSESFAAAKTQPQPDEYSGVYKNLTDGLLYELAKLKEDKDEQNKVTHFLRVPEQVNEKGDKVHPGLSWAGTKDEFKQHFERA